MIQMLIVGYVFAIRSEHLRIQSQSQIGRAHDQDHQHRCYERKLDRGYAVVSSRQGFPTFMVRRLSTLAKRARAANAMLRANLNPPPFPMSARPHMKILKSRVVLAESDSRGHIRSPSVVAAMSPVFDERALPVFRSVINTRFRIPANACPAAQQPRLFADQRNRAGPGG